MPQDDRKNEQNQQDPLGSGDERRSATQSRSPRLHKPVGHLGPAQRQDHEDNVCNETSNASVVRRWDSAIAQPNTQEKSCQTYDTMAVLAQIPVARPPATAGTPPVIRFLSDHHLAVIDRRDRIRPGVQRPDRRDRRRQVDPRRRRGPAARRAGVRRPRADRRRNSHSRGALRPPTARGLIVRREVSAQGRSRAFVDGQLVTTAHLREAVGAGRAARPARAPAPARSRRCSSRCSTLCRPGRRPRRPGVRARPAGRDP